MYITSTQLKPLDNQEIAALEQQEQIRFRQPYRDYMKT